MLQQTVVGLGCNTHVDDHNLMHCLFEFLMSGHYKLEYEHQLYEILNPRMTLEYLLAIVLAFYSDRVS